MIAIDTNILIRLIVDDDPVQQEASRALIRDHICFVPDSVYLETGWVLESVYELDRITIVNALRRLFGLHQIRVADPSRIDQALQWYAEGLDFGDALHLASSQKAERFVTFDRKFVSRSSGLGAVKVDMPMSQ